MSDEGAAITAASSLNGDGIMDMEDEAEDKRGEDDGKDISTTSDMGLDDTAVDNIKMPKAAVESVAEEPKVRYLLISCVLLCLLNSHLSLSSSIPCLCTIGQHV